MFFTSVAQLFSLLSPLFRWKKDDRVSCNCQAMENRANQNRGDEIQQDLQVFTNLWGSLRTKYEGTNITKTIARLLQMYQPEEGIDAYERLLKTVFVLLEDFDGLKLLVSMVPLPKNSTEEAINDVFFKATGFVRLDSPIFQQNQSLIPTVANSTDDDVKKDAARENISVAASRNVSGDIMNINANKVANKSHQTQRMPQEFHQFRGYSQAEIDPTVSQKMNYYSSNNSQVYPQTENAFQGYKMNWMQAPFIVQNGNVPLSNNYGDFLVKTEDNKYMRVPMTNVGVLLSCNNQNMQTYYPYQLIPTNRQSFVTEKSHSTPNKPIAIAPKEKIPSKISKKTEKIEEKSEKSKEIINEVSILENLTVSKNLDSCIERFLNRVKNRAESNTKRMNTSIKKTEVSCDKKEFISREINSHDDTNDLGKNIYMKNCDLASYKRHYYDTMLNYQRAKAVANSMTPVASTSSYDATYYEYLQQQQWMYQQQQRLIMSHQYAAQRLIQPEYSCIRNPYVRTNDWMSNCTTTRHTQEMNSGNFGFYKNNSEQNYELMTQNNLNPSKQAELKIPRNLNPETSVKLPDGE